MIKDFAKYYMNHKRLFALDFGCATLHGLMELAFPIAVTLFIQIIIPDQDLTMIMLGGAALLLIYLFNAGLDYIVLFWGHVLGITIETEMRQEAFNHLQKLSFSFFDGEKTGHLLVRITKDLEQIGEIAHHGPEDVFMALITFIGALALMFYIHPRFALMICVLAPMVVFVTTRYGRQMVVAWKGIFSRVGEFNARIEDNIGGVRVVKAFTNEQHEQDLFAVNNQNYKASKIRAYRYLAASMSLLYIGTRLVQVMSMTLGSYFVVEGSLDNGQFIGLILLVGVFVRPIEKISAVMETFTNGFAGFKRFQEFMAIKPQITDSPNAIDPGKVTGHICYEDVGFSYEKDGIVLNNISLQIQPGETIAFVGESGAGKTTLCALLPRFYEVSSGRITVDGHDIRDFKQQALRRNIGIVQQETFLFAGTLRENIAYGDLDADDDEIMEAARRAHLGDMIAQLPEGLDSIVGERGAKLSGGQRQRIAIARVFLKNPPIVILDEATSSLDSATERQIQKELKELTQGRTTLIITHRLTAIRSVDRIIVVGEGRLLEQGAEKELLVRGGAYSRLHGIQFGTVPAV